MLFSFLLVGIMTAGLADHLSNQQNEQIFYWFAGCFFAGLALLLMGVFYKRHFALPRDIDAAPTGPRVEDKTIRSESGSLVTRAVMSVSLLMSSLVVWYVWIERGGHSDGFFPLGIITLIVGVYALAGMANEQRRTAITINCTTQTISFTNSLSKKTRLYCFGEMDGFLYLKFYGGYHDHARYVVSLVKQGRRVENISSDVYRNFDALKQCLASLRQLRIADTLPVGCSRKQLLC
jgi:hypothetical protein